MNDLYFDSSGRVIGWTLGGCVPVIPRNCFIYSYTISPASEVRDDFYMGVFFFSRSAGIQYTNAGIKARFSAACCR